MNWIGSRWWKFDFHNHTPASDDYGKGPDQTQHKQISHKDWLLNYMRQGIDCVAVTDHNSGAWIDPLKQALQELAFEGHEDYRPLYLFPGVEFFTVNLPIENSRPDLLHSTPTFEHSCICLPPQVQRLKVQRSSSMAFLPARY